MTSVENRATIASMNTIEKRRIIMLDAKVAELLNVQVNKEFYSAYLYLDFSNYNFYFLIPGSPHKPKFFVI